MSIGPNVSSALFSQGSRRVRVRSGTGAYVDGVWVENSDRDRVIRIALRPISPSDRLLLPDGMRTEDSSIFLTRPSQTLLVEQSGANGSSAADRVHVDGWWWRIVGEKPWAANGYRRYLAIREDKGKERGQ